MINIITLDYETQSEADLKKLGAYEYALHPSTDIICAGYKVKGWAKPKLWVPKDGPPPKELVRFMTQIAMQFRAHNAFFEQCITAFVFFTKYLGYSKEQALKAMPPNRWYDTAAKAAACALPRSLEGACQALRLPIQKDMEGNRLMKKYMKPTQAWSKWAKNGGKIYDEALGCYFDMPEPQKWYNDEFELWDIYDYCLTDVDAQDLLDDTLPDLTTDEYENWLLNQKMNFRGVAVDRVAAKKIIAFNAEETKLLNNSLYQLTNGSIETATQTAKVLNFLQNFVDIDNLQANTLRDVLKEEDLNPTARKIIEIRLATSKTSNKKYQAMLDRSNSDGRVRDLALYHGASTGRESGRGLQVHNLPKGKIKDTYTALEIIHESETLEDLRMFYHSPVNVFSSCIRSTIMATEGHDMLVADFNAIEARMVNWLAKNQESLKAFASGKDQYIKMASRIFGIPEHVIALGVAQEDSDAIGKRFLGKTAVLGCGYQMGPDRFYQTCIEWGVPNVTKALAKKAVEVYRETHQPVVKLWANIEEAAIRAVQKRGVKVKVNRVAWFVKDNFLWCELPSGRRLAYYGPKIKNEPTPWGEIRPKLYHWYVDSTTKQWCHGATYGGKLVENISQACSRDITVNGIRNVERAGFEYLFQVHDEVISEAKIGVGDLEKYIELLTTLPAWAKDLPIKAAGWVGPRYKK